jgi:AcrR family transcriptional regulator
MTSFFGTMNEIAEGVGINKASLYNHFKGKEDLYFAVYEDLAHEYEILKERLVNESKNMEIPDKLSYIFKDYIYYFYRNSEISTFWNHILLFTPEGLREKFYTDLLKREDRFQKWMEEIFEIGMQKGILRKDHPKKLVMSYRAMRDGVLNWMYVIPESNDEWAKELWIDFWLGIKERNDTYEK